MMKEERSQDAGGGKLGCRRPEGADDPGVAGARGCSTTMIYTHVLRQGGLGVSSPLDG
jgi:hypothetical protein